jgi:hypothetical protein
MFSPVEYVPKNPVAPNNHCKKNIQTITNSKVVTPQRTISEITCVFVIFVAPILFKRIESLKLKIVKPKLFADDIIIADIAIPKEV